MLAAEALRIDLKRSKSRALIITLSIKTPATQTGNTTVTCLIDSGAEANFISQTLVKQMQLPEPKEVAKQHVETVDDRVIQMYEHHENVHIMARDSEGHVGEQDVDFWAIDMREYDMILEYSWLNAVDFDIRWHDRRWLYRDDDYGRLKQVSISLCSAKEFAGLAMIVIAGRDRAYVAMSYQMLLLAQSYQYRRRNVARCDALQVDRNDHISDAIKEVVEIFFKTLSDSLNTHDQVEHAIDLQSGKKPRPGSIYNMSHDEFIAIRNYLENALAKKWIRSSSASAGAFVLFVKKSDGSLRLCVNYRGLNEITIKNNYPLSLLSETLKRFANARHFIKIDIRNAYHRIRIRQKDEWKTAFRTRYEQYEYQVMFFDLANAFATFQSYVNEALKSYIDVFCVVYLNDVLIYSENEQQHWEHVRLMLKTLLRYRLYVKLKKCEFNKEEVSFLSFVVERNGIQMKRSRIDAIVDWSELESAKNIMIFLDFAGFYRRFVKEFSQIVTSFTNLTRDAKKEESRPSFAMTKEVKAAFNELKIRFTTAPILTHYDWEAKLRMKTDAFDRGADGVLNQKDKDDQWHPIAFSSYKFKRTEINWDTHDKKLYAIMLDFKNWRHYLQGSKHPIRVIFDHNNLRYFMTIKELNAKQIRWAEKLAAFDFNIEYRKNKLNPANAPSRRSDFMKPDGNDKNNDRFLFILRNKFRNQNYQPDLQSDQRVFASVKLAASTARLRSTATTNTRSTASDEKVLDRCACRILDTAAFRLLVHQIMKSKRFYLKLRESMIAWLLKLQQKDAFVVEKQWRQRYASKQNELSRWNVEENELLRRDLAIYVPEDFATRQEIFRMNHDDPDAEHFARARIENVVRRKYFWLDMIKKIADYVRICPDCQRMRVHRHKPYDDMVAISPDEEQSFDTVIMNFITDMPSARDSYTKKTSDSILILINKLTKYATYIAITKTLNAIGLANLLWREFVCRHEMMRSIISNRKSLFTSNFWSTLCWNLEAKRKLSTAFHPQTNEQTERQNAVLEHYLRVYCNFKQNNWPELLPMAQFAYNNSKHSSTDQASQELLSGYVAILDSDPVSSLQREETALATDRAETLRSNRAHLMKLWKAISEQQAKYYNENHIMKGFEPEKKMLLRDVNIRTLRSKKKIDHKQLSLFEIVKKIDTQAYEFDLFKQYESIHSVFHVFLLELWYSRDDANSKPQPILVKDEKKWEISQMLDKRIRKSQSEYLIAWVDSSPYENSWKSMKHLENAKDAIAKFENARELRKPERTAKRRRTGKFKTKSSEELSARKQARQSLKLKKRGRPRKQK